MNRNKKNNRSLLQKFIDLIARIFSVKRKKTGETKRNTEDIYPLW